MPLRNLLILGASGRTGRHVLALSRAAGLDVTVLVRDPTRLPDAAGVRAVVGSVTDGSDALDRAMVGQQAVISTLGVPGFKPDGLIARAAPAIVRAMQQHGVKRLIVTSAYGVGVTWRDTPWLPRLFIRVLLKDVYADKLAGETTIEASGLDWTIVHPTTLTDKPDTRRTRIGERLDLTGFPTIARSAVAAELVRQIDDVQYLRKHVLIST